MASLKGGDYFWDGSTVVANAAVSKLVNIGPGPYVAIFITNATNLTATFKIQAAFTALPQPGRNALDGTPDGGLQWFDYIPVGATSTPAISVAQNASYCYELSPFGPEFIRLVRTDSTGAAAIIAGLSSFGAN